MTATIGTVATSTSGRAALKRTLAALIVVEVFSGFQQSYFTPLFSLVGDRYHVGVTALAWTVTGMGLISGAGRILVVDGVRPEEIATSEGQFELLITLGSAAGSAVYAAILASGPGIRGYQTAWAVGAGVALAGMVAAFALSRKVEEG